MSTNAFGVEDVSKRFFSAKARKKDAKKGDALKDGSFPIKDKADLANAERLEHFSKHPSAAAKLIARKKKEFGVSKSAFGVEHISKGSPRQGLKLISMYGRRKPVSAPERAVFQSGALRGKRNGDLGRRIKAATEQHDSSVPTRKVPRGPKMPATADTDGAS